MRVCVFGQLVQYGKEISLLQYAHFPFTYLLFYDCGKQESGRATFIVGVRIRRANELLELSETGAVGETKPYSIYEVGVS